ncbi:unnamed protein product, partial [Pieris brassicae]
DDAKDGLDGGAEMAESAIDAFGDIVP